MIESRKITTSWPHSTILFALSSTILYPLIKMLFCEVNPIPVKAACAAMGFCENRLRLPLTQMEPQNELLLLREMRKLGILK